MFSILFLKVASEEDIRKLSWREFHCFGFWACTEKALSPKVFSLVWVLLKALTGKQILNGTRADTFVRYLSGMQGPSHPKS